MVICRGALGYQKLGLHCSDSIVHAVMGLIAFGCAIRGELDCGVCI
jgi:hypothetical protein